MNHKKRSYLFQFLDVKDQHTYQQIGYLGDVSDEGMMFITALNLTPDWTCDVYIENNLIADDQEPVSVKARIQALWVKPSINPQMQCVGCKILDIDSSSQKKLNFLATSIRFSPEFEVHRTARLQSAGQ